MSCLAIGVTIVAAAATWANCQVWAEFLTYRVYTRILSFVGRKLHTSTRLVEEEGFRLRPLGQVAAHRGGVLVSG